jgi:sialic acid synthase SpsE
MSEPAPFPYRHGSRCLLVAEAGVNHNGSPDLAQALVDAAASSGADAIKFQSYKADRLSTRTAPLYWSSAAKSQHEVFAALDGLPTSVLGDLLAQHRIPLFSTPFDLGAVDELEAIGVPCYKIASADITYLELLRAVARTGKPVILSTGASTLAEVERAVRAIEDEGNKTVILLHCTLKYPCPVEAVNLRAMRALMDRFQGYPVGLSDHTIGTTVAIAAAAMGAWLVEKHFTIDTSLPGSPDHKMSMDPVQCRVLADAFAEIEAAQGDYPKRCVAQEQAAYLYARRSVVATRALPLGHVIRTEDVTCKRPGTGIPADQQQTVLGRRVRQRIEEDEVLQWKDLE